MEPKNLETKILGHYVPPPVMYSPASSLLQNYIQIHSLDPGVLYEWLTAHPNVVTQDNIAKLDQLIADALTNDKDDHHHQNADHGHHHQHHSEKQCCGTTSSQQGGNYMQLASFFHFKKTVLKYCLEAGIESFFGESLQSNPPDATAQRFQTELIAFRQQLIKNQSSPSS